MGASEELLRAQLQVNRFDPPVVFDLHTRALDLGRAERFIATGNARRVDEALRLLDRLRAAGGVLRDQYAFTDVGRGRLWALSGLQSLQMCTRQLLAISTQYCSRHTQYITQHGCFRRTAPSSATSEQV